MTGAKKAYLWGLMHGVALCVGLSSVLTTRPLPPLEAYGMIAVVGVWAAVRLWPQSET